MFSRRLSSSSRRSSSSTRTAKSVEKHFKSTKSVFHTELFQFGTTSPVSSIAKLLLRAATADKIAPAHSSSQSAPNTPLNRCAPVIAWDAPMTPITTSDDLTDHILASPLEKTSHVNWSNDKENKVEMASKFSKIANIVPRPLLQTKKNADSEFWTKISTSSESTKVWSPVEKTKETNMENNQKTLEGVKVTDSELKSMLSAPTNNLTTPTKKEVPNSGSFAQSAQKTLEFPELSQKPNQISPAKTEELAKAEEQMKAYLEAKQAKILDSKSTEAQNSETSPAQKDELINVEPPSHLKPETPEKEAAVSEAQKPSQISPAKNEDIAKAEERMKAYLEAKQTKIQVSKSMDVQKSEKSLATKDELIDVEPSSHSKPETPEKKAMKPESPISKPEDIQVLEKNLASKPETPEKKANDSETQKPTQVSPAKNDEIAKAEERMKAYLEAKQTKNLTSKSMDVQNSETSPAPKDELIDVKPSSHPKPETHEKKGMKPENPISKPEDIQVMKESQAPKIKTPEKKTNDSETQKPTQVSPAKNEELAKAEERMKAYLEAKQAKNEVSKSMDVQNSGKSQAPKDELIDVEPSSHLKPDAPEKKDTKQLKSPISTITDMENSEKSLASKDELIDVKNSSHSKTESTEKKGPEDMHGFTKSLAPKLETPEKKVNGPEAQEPQKISPAKVNELAKAEKRMDEFLAKDVVPSTPIMRNVEEKFVFSPLKEEIIKSKDPGNCKLTTSKDISPKQCTPYKNRMVHLTSLFSPEKDLNALNDYMENKSQFGPTMNKLMGEMDTDTIKTQASTPEEPIENPPIPLVEPKNLKPSDEKWLLKGLAMVFGGKTTSSELASESTTSSELASESTTCSELSSELLTTSSEIETTSSENTVLSVSICPDELRNALSETENRKDQGTSYTSEHLRIAFSSPVKSCFPNSDLLEKVPEWLPHAETPCPSPFGQNFKKSMRPSLPKYSSKDRARSLPINLPFPQPKKKIV